MPEIHSVDAIARVLGKNLAIWTWQQGGLPVQEGLAHGYIWNPEAPTLHLLHRNGNHFNRLVPLQ